MAGTTDYSTGFGRQQIYKLQPAATEGQVEVFSSGTKAIFGEGAKLEMKAGSTFNLESGSVGIIEGVQRIASGGQIEIQSGAELELESGSTMNVESGGYVKVHAGGVIRASSGAWVEQRGIRTYTCTTSKLNIYDRVSIIQSSDPQEWTLGPPGTHIGLIKTIIFQALKGDTHNIALNCTHKSINFGTTSIHNIIAGGTNPRLLSATGAMAPLSVTLYAQSSASWLILTNLSTDVNVGKLQATSSTGFF